MGLGLGPSPNPYPNPNPDPDRNPDHLLRGPKVEVINAWRDVGRELVRLCQVQHAAASPGTAVR